MGLTNASWKHLTVAMEPIFFVQFIHFGRFCLRAVKIYNHKNSKILTPILIIGFVMWIFPFRNWHNSDHRNRVYECLWAISTSHQVLCRKKVLRLALDYSKSEIYAVHIWWKLRNEIKRLPAILMDTSHFQFTHFFIACWNIFHFYEYPVKMS